MTTLIAVSSFALLCFLISYIRRIRREIKHIKRLQSMENNGKELELPRSIGEWERRCEESRKMSEQRRNGGVKK